MAAGRKSGWWKRKLLVSLGVLVVLAAVGGAFTWYKFFREEPQPDWITKDPDMRFKYGSIGAEREAGMPYWIFYVLPRMFPDKLPKPGGLAALGVSWEQGQELPIGLTKKVVGFPRVANNCASCHAAGYQTSPEENPVFVRGLSPGHRGHVLRGARRFRGRGRRAHPSAWRQVTRHAGRVHQGHASQGAPRAAAGRQGHAVGAPGGPRGGDPDAARGDLATAMDRFSDAGTSDFLTGLMEKHEKMAWMLRAFVEA